MIALRAPKAIVDLYDRNKARVQTPLALSVQRYSALAIGGPENAVLAVQAAPSEQAHAAPIDDVRKWLGYYVIIRNRYGTPVWWGRVEEANTAYEGVNVGVRWARCATGLACCIPTWTATAILYRQKRFLPNTHGASKPTAFLRNATRWARQVQRRQ